MENEVAATLVPRRTNQREYGIDISSVMREERREMSKRLRSMKFKYFGAYISGLLGIPSNTRVSLDDTASLADMKQSVGLLINYANDAKLPLFHERVLMLRQGLERFCYYTGVVL